MTRPLRPALGAALFLVLALYVAGCSGRDPAGLEVARAPIDPLVFVDAYDPDVYFQAFMDTDPYVVGFDSVFVHDGSYSMTITVPPEGSNLGGYAGGVLTAVGMRDMADFNALTFYARASIPCALDVAGFGNDNTGTSLYEAGRAGIPLTTDWTFVVVPIPSPSKLVAERGLFTFAEGRESGYPEGHVLWFDDIRYAWLGNITDQRPYMPTLNKQYFVGVRTPMTGTRTTFDVDGADVTVYHLPAYFDYASSDPSVATVERGVIRVVGVGDAEITATLDGTDVDGTATVSGYAPPQGPAPRPTVPAARVISLFSDAYEDETVTSFNPHWQYSTTEDAPYAIKGDQSIMYSFMNFVGIDFRAQTLDVSAMTHFHLDVYAPEGTTFLVKLVTFNADNGYGIQNRELTFTADSTPAFLAGEWSSLEIPMEAFGFTASLDHMGQVVLSTIDEDPLLVLVDNMYWHR
jgi:hypothetical protein